MNAIANRNKDNCGCRDAIYIWCGTWCKFWRHGVNFHNGVHVWKYCLRSTPVKPHTHHLLNCDQPYASCGILSIATANNGIAHKDITAKATTSNNLKNILRAYKWLSGKESICWCRRHRRCGRCRFDPFPPGRSPGGGNGNPLQYICLENSMDRGAWQAIVHRVAKSQTRLSTCALTHTHTHTHNALNVLTILRNLWLCFATYTPFILLLISSNISLAHLFTHNKDNSFKSF